MPIEVLVVEDDPDLRELIILKLSHASSNGLKGMHITGAADGEEALRLVKSGECRPAIVVSDYRLPGNKTGLQWMRDAKPELREARKFLYTGSACPDLAQIASEEGVVCISKTLPIRELPYSLSRYAPELRKQPL